jgi:PAS domain S-box-containing protein
MAPSDEQAAGGVQQLAEIVSLASGGLWLVDGEHRTLAISRAAADLMGYEPNELVGQPTLGLNARPDAAQRHRAALSLDGTHDGEAVVLGKNGQHVRLRYQSRQLLIDGEPVVLGTVERAMPEGVVFGAIESAMAEGTMTARDVLQEFKQAGVPQGYWLLRIEQGEQSLRVIEDLLHDLHNAVIGEVADEPFAR